jgi:hypothetical protein
MAGQEAILMHFQPENDYFQAAFLDIELTLSWARFLCCRKTCGIIRPSYHPLVTLVTRFVIEAFGL